MSPSSSDPIASMTQTCAESRSVATDHYALLFPASSTWFSFSEDFLYLDFGISRHVLHYCNRHFDGSIPRRFNPRNPACQYRYPKFDKHLLRKVKNLAFDMVVPLPRRVHELLAIFCGVEIVVLIDPLFSMCREYGDELVWLKGELGDEISSLSRIGADSYGTGQMDEFEVEKDYRDLLYRLMLWKTEGIWGVFWYRDLDEIACFWEKSGIGRPMPRITRKIITTANLKDALLNICGSEDDYEAFVGLDWSFVQGDWDYCGPLDLFQQLSFLELALARKTAEMDLHCSCSSDEWDANLDADIPFLLYRIDMLVLEIMHQQEPKQAVDKKHSACIATS